MEKWDSENLEIRSKSVEQTLVPLVTQITTLVNHKDNGRRSEKARKAIHEIGKVVAFAVDRFVSVGEQIAEENEDVASEMRKACEEAKKSGQAIFDLTSTAGDVVGDDGVNAADKSGMVRAARSLLSAVTRVLIIADSVVVKRLLKAVKKVDDRLRELEGVNTFTDFVQAFSQFGSDMVELAHLSGDRQNDLKDDTLKAEMGAARSILEKSTMMLLTTSKTCLRHPDSRSAKGNREGVFKKMREAMATITSVVQDEHNDDSTENGGLAMDLGEFESVLEAYKQSSPDDSECKIKFQKAFAKILDDVQSVVNSPHMRKEKRESILALCENAQDIMKDILEKHKDNKNEDTTSIDTLDMALQRICKTSKDLRHEVHQVATDQVFETFSHLGHKKSLPALRNAAASGSTGQLENLANIFTQDAKRLQEVSRVTRNMASNKPIAITAQKVEENIETLCPQVIHAARTLASHPISKIAQENMEVFVDVWEAQVDELGKVLRLITAGGDPSKSNEIEDEPVKKTCESRVDLLLKSSSKWNSCHSSEVNYKPEKAVVDSKEQEKLGKLITNVNLMTSQLELHYLEDTDNEIVIRAREMSEMVSDMYLFTRGEGLLQTTGELFEASQNFADAGKALYRVARKYAAKAEENEMKKELLRCLDKIPAYCHQLMFTSRSLAIGQSACCRKVWGVMHLTKNIIKIVARVVNNCYLLAERNSPLKLPPDQRLWKIDESIFSEESSVALAKVFLVILVSFVLCTLPFLTRPELPSTKWNWTYAAVSAYMIFVQIQSVYKYKWFPLATYTCWSYFLLNLHFLFHAVDFPLAAELLRFPSLAMATVTTTVWWLVLFPVILGFCDSKSRSGFMKLNFSFFLMNMHLLNFPLALSSYWLLPRALVFTDFWVATIVAIVYLFFYLLVLDPNGVHLYIILSPRPWWCVLSYSGILALYAGLFQAFSHHPHLG